MFSCCRAIKIADADDVSSTESPSDLQLLLESRIKCYNNLAATQLKVIDASDVALYLFNMEWVGNVVVTALDL